MRGVAAIATVAALALTAAPAWADDPDLLAVGAGAYNVMRNAKEAQLRLEYRFSYRFLHIIRPVAGALVTNKGSNFTYGGFRLDADVTRHFVITPEATMGYWSRGNGKDLGGHFEFKTGGELAWRFDDNSRLGFLFDHISNAGIYKKNPGVESALLVYSIPLSWGR
jgi:lipid A 3-O-deacylase